MLSLQLLVFFSTVSINVVVVVFFSFGDFVHLNLFMPSFFIGMITSMCAVENVRRVNQYLVKVGFLLYCTHVVTGHF